MLLAGDITPSHALHKVLENKILAQLIFDVFQINYLYLIYFIFNNIPIPAIVQRKNRFGMQEMYIVQLLTIETRFYELPATRIYLIIFEFKKL